MEVNWDLGMKSGLHRGAKTIAVVIKKCKHKTTPSFVGVTPTNWNYKEKWKLTSTEVKLSSCHSKLQHWCSLCPQISLDRNARNHNCSIFVGLIFSKVPKFLEVNQTRLFRVTVWLMVSQRTKLKGLRKWKVI